MNHRVERVLIADKLPEGATWCELGGCVRTSQPSARVLAGRYRIDCGIAAGAMGEVWQGEDLALRRPVAVKLMRDRFAADPDAAARFRAEARCAARLNHPGIVKVYDYRDGQSPFLVMEHVDGPSLALLLFAGPLAPWRALDVVAQAARALQASHAAGVIHCDVKPANLLIAPGGAIKLTDFGTAHLASSARLTALGPVLGTPAYLAPERTAGAQPGPASDVYSLGVVLYECLTGARPFAGTTAEVAYAHLSRPFPPLPKPALPAISDLLADMTAKEPRVRPSSADAVASQAAALRDELLLRSAATSDRAVRVRKAAGARRRAGRQAAWRDILLRTCPEPPADLPAAS